MGGFWALLFAILGLRSVCGPERTPRKAPCRNIYEETQELFIHSIYLRRGPQNAWEHLGTPGNSWGWPIKLAQTLALLTTIMEDTDVEATQTAQSDWEHAMEDSDSEYNPSDSSSVVAITARLCENEMAKAGTTDLESDSSDDPFRFSRPSSSGQRMRTKRTAPEPASRDDLSLSHLTPLNAKGLTKRQRCMVKEMREQHKKEKAAKRKEEQEARQAAKAAKQPEVKLRSWSITLAFIGRDIPEGRLAEWRAFVLRQPRGITATERGGTCQNLHAQSAIECMSEGVRTLRREIIKELGWDSHPPTEQYRITLKEIDGSKGLYESFDAFTGYIQKDSGLYPDWSIEHTDSVTPDMLALGVLLFCGCSFVLKLLWLYFYFRTFRGETVTCVGSDFFRSACLLRHSSRH